MSRTAVGGPAFAAAGKAMASHLARLVEPLRLVQAAETLELFARTLQSKGVDTSLADQIKSISRLLPAEAVVFDVGANVGNWTRALLARCGDRIAQVHCFEPVEANIERIRAIGDPKVVVHPFAVGEQEETREFYSDFVGSGIASLYLRDTPDAPAMRIRQTVQVRPLDAVIAELGLQRIDLLKMDVEGAELEALRGLSNSVAQGIVRAFTFEIGTVNITSRTYLSDFFNIAVNHGFEVYRLTAGGGLHPIKSYRVSHECFATTNYAAVAASKAASSKTVPTSRLRI